MKKSREIDLQKQFLQQESKLENSYDSENCSSKLSWKIAHNLESPLHSTYNALDERSVISIESLRLKFSKGGHEITRHISTVLPD